MSADPYKEGWQQGVRQAIIEAENVANDADSGGEWQDPGTQLRSTLIPALRKMLPDANANMPPSWTSLQVGDLVTVRFDGREEKVRVSALLPPDGVIFEPWPA
jgi:hypothetical protein